MMSGIMLSPKVQRMQRSIRINDGQLLGLAEKARYDSRLAGFLYKRCADNNKWLLRWFRLYQNLMFYYDSEQSVKPIGVIFLEGCYCERVLNPSTGTTSGSSSAMTGNKTDHNRLAEKMYCFAIMYRRENQRQYELRADTASECKAWIDGIKMASFNKLHLQMEELEQKHLHLLQVVESEKTAKWQYTQHCEELTEEIKKLRTELFALKKEWRLLPQVSKSTTSSQECDKSEEDEDPDIAKIKKVQSFFRGWLCRRRWKQIVEEYIRSPHAESMRKRNCLVFRMVEAEEEYVEQLEILISCFLRPFKMAASSKNPPCTHEDINSIFLNSETVLFLHQIFLKGLTARMESWPTLVLGTSLGDLFDMLLPMLSIYQEYVRNHHYCLQVLTECKQSPMFGSLLNRLEKKPACKGRSLETFLTYPMHQIPRYIITLHELLAHTPPDHVEKKSLEHARKQLEDLSRQMHDEVSETENIRKNLAIERMIVEGCDILLDVNQMFVRQGTLVQILPAGHRSGARGRLTIGREKEREAVRQCFLFSNHLIITSRTQGGKLHLVENVGKIPLADITLIEDPNEEERTEEPESPCSSHSGSLSDMSTESNGSFSKAEHRSLDFKLIVDDVKTGQQISIHLVTPTRQEKAAWITDISQCMDNVHFNGLFYNTMPNANSSTLPQCVKSDPNLFKDDVDIRFSKTFNTCKIPQIRYATPERLLQRLTDLRFLNIDFLNTFLLTYRVFTDGITVLEALKSVFFQPEPTDSPTSSNGSLENLHREDGDNGLQAASVAATHNVNETLAATLEGKRRISTCSGYSTATDNGVCLGYDRARIGCVSPRRISGASSISGYYSDDRDGGGRSSFSQDSSSSFLGAHKSQHWRYSFRKYEEEQRESANQQHHHSLFVAETSSSSTRHHARSSITSLQAPMGSSAQGRSGSHDSGGSRSGSIVSSSAMWRKESVTIPEKAEDVDEDEDESILPREPVTATTLSEPRVELQPVPTRVSSEVKTAEKDLLASEVSTRQQASRRLSASGNRVTSMAAKVMRRASSGGDAASVDENFLTVPQTVTASSSAETLTDNTLTGPPTPTSISVTLIPSSPSTSVAPSDLGGPAASVTYTNEGRSTMSIGMALTMTPVTARKKSAEGRDLLKAMHKPPSIDEPSNSAIKSSSAASSGGKKASIGQLPVSSSCVAKGRNRSTSTFSTASSASACFAFHHLNPDPETGGDGSDLPMACQQASKSQPCSHHPSFSGPSSSGSRNIFSGLSFKDLAAGMKSPTREMKKRKGFFQRPSANSEEVQASSGGSPLTSPQHKVGVVITSSRQAHRSNKKKDGHENHCKPKAEKKAHQDSKFPATDGVSLEYFLSELSDDDNASCFPARRSSSASAAVAFAVATAGSGNPPDHGPPNRRGENFRDAAKRKCSITSNVSTLRVLSVLRHWVTKHSQDFESNPRLKNLTIEFLEDIICTPTLLPSEHRASSQLLRMLTKDEPSRIKINLDELLTPIQVPSKENISTLSALEVAEQMTFLDQKIMFTIMSSEFLEQAWLKSEKAEKAPHIVIMTKRFNDMSRLVVSEILTQPCVTSRVQAIEKWTAVADICRCLHNFNGVLQICAAFTNSAVFRLKSTWNRVSKSTRQTVEKLQSLVSSDGRFRNLRDSLHRTDPPCIPYLGMYLSDLTFIEEGTPNFTDNGLLNFAKMRMIAHVIREIRQFQQTPYKIEPIPKVVNYLLDPSRLLDDEDLYQKSLILEPRTSRLSSSYGHGMVVAVAASNANQKNVM